jgi:alpha-tubulin suppressor-like RCC1 family protein
MLRRHSFGGSEVVALAAMVLLAHCKQSNPNGKSAPASGGMPAGAGNGGGGKGGTAQGSGGKGGTDASSGGSSPSGAGEGGDAASAGDGGEPASGGTTTGGKGGGSTGGAGGSGGKAAGGKGGGGGTSGVAAAANGGSGGMALGPKAVVDADVCYQHACAVLADGTLKCWGSNNWGQLGYGDRTIGNFMTDRRAPDAAGVDLGPGRTAVSVAVAPGTTCALLDDGSVKCWGVNDVGQLGIGTMGTLPQLSPGQAIDFGQPAKRMAFGIEAGCAFLEDNSTKCWGTGWTGHDEYQNLAPPALPIDWGGLPNATKIWMGYAYQCGVFLDASARCWGDENTGNLGYEGNESLRRPAAAAVLQGASQIVPAFNHTCGIHNDGELRCWGANDSGQLGYGDFDRRDTPGPVIRGDVAEVALGDAHTCARLVSGNVLCWGEGDDGVLGNGSEQGITEPPADPIDLGTGRTAVAIRVDGQISCAILDDGSMKCWGLNASGVLGQGNLEPMGDEPGEMGDALPPIQF